MVDKARDTADEMERQLDKRTAEELRAAQEAAKRGRTRAVLPPLPSPPLPHPPPLLCPPPHTGPASQRVARQPPNSPPLPPPPLPPTLCRSL